MQTRGLAQRPRAVCSLEGARSLEHGHQLTPLLQGHDAGAVIAAAHWLAVYEYVGHRRPLGYLRRRGKVQIVVCECQHIQSQRSNHRLAVQVFVCSKRSVPLLVLVTSAFRRAPWPARSAAPSPPNPSGPARQR